MPMDKSGAWIADQAAHVACWCGITLAEHAGVATHPFVPLPAYNPATWKRGARFAHEGLDLPGELYVTVEDRLRVNIYNFNVGAEVDAFVRLLLPDGQIIPIRQQMLPSGGGALSQFDINLAEGMLLDVVFTTPTVSLRRGQTFLDAGLIRGTGATAFPVRGLVDGYITSQTGLGFPATNAYEAVQGLGFITSVNVANPAAGADWSFLVPSNKRVEVHAITAQLVTSAAVANRQAVLKISDPSNNVTHITLFSGVQTASTTFQYSAGEGDPISLNGTFESGPLPVLCMLAQGWHLASVTAALDVADQWSNIWMMQQQWSEI